jgi:hypothetical protein
MLFWLTSFLLIDVRNFYKAVPDYTFLKKYNLKPARFRQTTA